MSQEDSFGVFQSLPLYNSPLLTSGANPVFILLRSGCCRPWVSRKHSKGWLGFASWYRGPQLGKLEAGGWNHLEVPLFIRPTPGLGRLVRSFSWNCHLEHLHIGSKREWPREGTFQKTSAPREAGRRCFYDLPAKVLSHLFRHALLAKIITSPLRFKGRGPRTSYFPPLWGMASFHWRTPRRGEVFAITFGKSSFLGRGWGMWGCKNIQLIGKNWYMNR